MHEWSTACILTDYVKMDRAVKMRIEKSAARSLDFERTGVAILGLDSELTELTWRPAQGCAGLPFIWHDVTEHHQREFHHSHRAGIDVG
jgi:hypothetical protein